MVWDKGKATYKACCETRENKNRARVSFLQKLLQVLAGSRYYHAHIVTGRPGGDMCWTCQQIGVATMKMANSNTDHKKNNCIKYNDMIFIYLPNLQALSVAKAHFDVDMKDLCNVT